MLQHYQDYYWKMGKPYGRKPTKPNDVISYKIVTDPYHKRYSIEQYKHGHFDKLIYDSILLDFRQLTALDQVAWSRQLVQENPQTVKFLIRDQNDRAVLLETQHFKDQWCRSCSTSSIHGTFLSVHQMYYTHLQDSFNGVVLYDILYKPVMYKLYETDPLTSEFTLLLKNEWNLEELPQDLNLQASLNFYG